VIGKGCTSIILALGIISILFFSGCTSFMRSFADWRMSANGATVAIQQTEQVRLHEDGATERTEIEWSARMSIAETEAGATKESSWPYLLLWPAQYILKLLTVILVLVAVAIVALAVLAIYQKKGVSNASL
jgi:hypothetical protein